MGRPLPLGDLERRILLAVLELGSDAYAAAIGQALEVGGGKALSRGALYTTLDRLESKGHLTWKTAATTPARGGIPRRAFRVTPDGLTALRADHHELQSLVRQMNAVLGR